VLSPSQLLRALAHCPHRAPACALAKPLSQSKAVTRWTRLREGVFAAAAAAIRSGATEGAALADLNAGALADHLFSLGESALLCARSLVRFPLLPSARAPSLHAGALAGRAFLRRGMRRLRRRPGKREGQEPSGAVQGQQHASKGCRCRAAGEHACHTSRPERHYGRKPGGAAQEEKGQKGCCDAWKGGSARLKRTNARKR
jgi:hypothetical protein